MSAAATIIGLWPTVRCFAEDIGVSLKHAHVMKVRGVIPAARWPSVVSAAARRQIALSYHEVASLHLEAAPAQAEESA